MELKFKGNEKEYLRQYYQANKDKFRGYSRKKRAKNPEAANAAARRSKDKNREKVRAYNKAWAKANSGIISAHARNRQALQLNRIPKWLSEADRIAIKEFYVNRPKGFHVDHILPLKGKDVSGLHVPWNLQYLPALENVKKSNKITKT